MQSVTGQEKFPGQARGPAGPDKFKVGSFAGSVDFVPDHGKTAVGQMHTDLVRAPGQRASTDQRHVASATLPTPLDPQLGPGRRAAFMHASLEPYFRGKHFPLADDRRIDRHLIPVGSPVHDGQILLADCPLLHGQTQGTRPRGSERQQHQAARFSIESRDDGKLSAVGQFVGKQRAQAVPQRGRPVRPRRVREESGRLVHGDPVCSLGHHTEVVLREAFCSETLVFCMIRLSHVSRVYQSDAGEVHALRDVTLEIEPGTFAAVTGPSGCGKSTLLNLLGGLDQPTAGEIAVDGLRLDEAGEAGLTAYRRDRLGVVFQFFNLLPSMTAAENVELPLLLRGDGAREARSRALEMLDLAGLAHRAGAFPHQMSGGEMQRAAVARALVHRPALLLADEPTGNLDSDNAARVLSLLQKIASQGLATLIIVTHSPEAAAVASRQIPMVDGRLAA